MSVLCLLQCGHIGQDCGYLRRGSGHLDRVSRIARTKVSLLEPIVAVSSGRCWELGAVVLAGDVFLNFRYGRQNSVVELHTRAKMRGEMSRSGRTNHELERNSLHGTSVARTLREKAGPERHYTIAHIPS